MDATALIEGFEPESALEQAVAGDPGLLEGLAWGKPRPGHPEGSVGHHVADLLAAIDARGVGGERRATLRFMALVHDSFKYRVRDWLPKTGENHHAMRARRFAERFTGDERILGAIELHDRPYAIWRRMKRTGTLDESRFAGMLERLPDPALFVLFVELDGSTTGKRQEAPRWFREELTHRGVELTAEAAAAGPRET